MVLLLEGDGKFLEQEKCPPAYPRALKETSLTAVSRYFEEA
jgi:hypothetical protein